MFRHGRLLVVSLVVSCTPKPQAALSVSQAKAIGDSVRSALAAYADRLNHADPDSLGRFYADDPRFVWAADGGVGVRTAAQVRTELAPLAAYPRWHIEYQDSTIAPLAPGVAALTTRYQMRFTDSAGKAVAFSGALSVVWIDTRAGWKILLGHSSSPPRPLP